MVNANERRKRILEVLNVRRFDTISNLALEFGVSRNTICNDIIILSSSSPIYTQKGGKGGVYVCDGYKLDKEYLTSSQETLLREIRPSLNTYQKTIMDSILLTFSMPKAWLYLLSPPLNMKRKPFHLNHKEKRYK